MFNIPNQKHFMKCGTGWLYHNLSDEFYFGLIPFTVTRFILDT